LQYLLVAIFLIVDVLAAFDHIRPLFYICSGEYSCPKPVKDTHDMVGS